MFRSKKGYYVVWVNDVPKCYPSGHFPRKFRYKKEAIDAAKEAVKNGASMARVEFPDMGELDFYPPKPEQKKRSQ